MDWLNYHHLLYFWTVARYGGVTKASEQLNLAQSTISGQIRTLEDALDEKLLVRSGRTVALTEVGQVVYQYADEIFSLGRELTETLKGNPAGRPMRLRVGVTDVMPKIISCRLLQPALGMQNVQLACYDDKTDRLLAELANHRLDLVLADAPLPPRSDVRAFNHLLGECGITFFAVPEVAKRHRRDFPNSLDGAPMLLPTPNTLLRRQLDGWFSKIEVQPRVVAEFEEVSLLEVFGETGAGLFCAPTIVERQVRDAYGVRTVGSTDEVTGRYYAITVQRQIKHPAAMAISDHAQNQLFG